VKLLITLSVIPLICFAPACSGDGDGASATNADSQPDGSTDTEEGEACDPGGFQQGCPDGLLCEDGVCVTESACTDEPPADCCCDSGVDNGWTCHDGQWSGCMYEMNGADCSDPCGPCFHPYNCPQDVGPDPDMGSASANEPDIGPEPDS
jgi:hypothetical protein